MTVPKFRYVDGEPADDAKAIAAEMAGELERAAGATLSGVSTADNREGRHLQKGGFAINV